MTVCIRLFLPDADTALLRQAANACNTSLERFIVEAATERATKMRMPRGSGNKRKPRRATA